VRLAWFVLVMFAVGLVVLVLCLVYRAPVGWTGGFAALAPQLGKAWHVARGSGPAARLDGDRLLFAGAPFTSFPLELRAHELHSIVPIWTAPRGWRSMGRGSPVVGSKTVLAFGQATATDKGPALVFVLRSEQRWASNRRPLRGLIVHVSDLGAAQRAVQPLGLLARLTPGAFDWLRPDSTATSPGPLPVYGT
jgi:hypothetical protein